MPIDRVVVVDDNLGALRALTRMLGRTGLEATCFSTYNEALSGLSRLAQPPVAALIDVILDRGHLGIDIASQIRERLPDCVSIGLMSGYRLEGELELSARSIKACLLEKPIAAATIRHFLIDAIICTRGVNGVLSRAIMSLVEESDLLVQEVRILVQLVAGTARSSLSDELALSPDTVKWQMKRLLTKTHTSDTAGLLGLVLKRANGLSVNLA